jgi:hypothetical protein
VVAKQAGASIPPCSTENGGAKFRKKEWQRIRDQIKAATIFARLNLVSAHGAPSVWLQRLVFPIIGLSQIPCRLDFSKNWTVHETLCEKRFAGMLMNK